MLRVLLASQPARAGWLGGTTVSTVTHGALIALAVVSTGSTFTGVREERAAAPAERITYIVPPRASDGAGRSGTSGAPRRAVERALAAPTVNVAALQDRIAAALDVPDLTAATDLTAVTDAWLARPDGLSAPSMTAAELLNSKSAFVAPANGIYTADLVERGVEPRRGNPKPRYPSALADLGVEGAFLVRFVVDSTGSVPENQIEFPGTMHRLFAAAVRVALLKSHFAPARAGGHVVPQEVVQEFRFELGRRRP